MRTRDHSVEHLKNELDSINAGLAMYETRLRRASADTQSRLQEDFDLLRSKRDGFARKIEALRASDNLARDEQTSDAENTATEFRRALERARERMDH
ncbi:MAG: hypothetical protein KY410_01900 [Proteobacteria bacterium]|nr:hypothetical protein [Pseudomonadota bacterium]